VSSKLTIIKSDSRDAQPTIEPKSSKSRSPEESVSGQQQNSNEPGGFAVGYTSKRLNHGSKNQIRD